MNVASIILIVCLYPFVLIMYALLKNEATPKKGMYYGVTLNKEQQKAPEIELISQKYHKQMHLGLLLLMVLPLPMLFIPWFSIFMTFWMIWMLASVFVFFIPFGIAHKSLKELKLEKGWKNTQQDAPIYVELKDAGNIRKVKLYHFLPPVILSVVILIKSIFFYPSENNNLLCIMQGTFLSVTFLFWIVAVWMDRQKTQIISLDSDANVNYARAKKNLWKNFWVICSWVNVAYMVSMLLSFDSQGRFNSVFWAATTLYTLLTLLLLFWLMKKKSSLDDKYKDKMDATLTDDDDNWLWGMVYYNPKDKHSMVEKRVGMGTTINMATPVGKGFAVFGVASLLSLPLLCIWIIMLEFTPIQLTIEDNQVVASHINKDYCISLDDIQNMELLTELPKMSRNHGTSIDNLKKGSFRIRDVGNCEVFVNPQNEVFIRLDTDQETYYLSGYDDTETMQIYEQLN